MNERDEEVLAAIEEMLADDVARSLHRITMLSRDGFPLPGTKPGRFYYLSRGRVFG